MQEEEEVEDTEPLITSRRRSVNPVAVDEPEPEVVEVSPSAIVADVLGDLELVEVVKSQPRAEGDDGDTQSFAFDTREGEDLSIEGPVEHLVEGYRQRLRLKKLQLK